MASTDEKSWYLSKGVWGGIIAAVVGIIGMFGLAMPEGSVDFLTDEVMKIVGAIATIVAGVIAIIGRVKATTRITK